MKITGLDVVEIDASQRGNWLFVCVHTDSGITGVGEASQSGNDALTRAALQQLGERLGGEDPTQPEVLWDRIAHSHNIFSSGAGRVGATAVSAIDQAVWDIAGKALNVPTWRLLGGRRRQRVRCYANLNRGTSDRSPEGFARQAVSSVKAGFRAVKATPFDEVRYANADRDSFAADVEKGIERLFATREAIGGEIELLVDCHCRFDLAWSCKIAERLRPLDLYWLEEPMPRDQIDAWAHLTAHSGHTIAGLEACFGRTAFESHLRRRALHVIMPDVKHAGGITEMRRIADLAALSQVPVAPHNPAGPVSTMASVQVAATIGNFLVLEWPFGEVPWRGDLLQPAETLVDGYIEVPDLPGLGFELRHDVVDAHVAGD
ncbi:MAG: mandelate racemase/muconate lactonizing enzyme family protein [Candidatus Latescibacterota bacterium]|nr:mandelate racemase/muconate lactonizing enzyme family protein [Candidatus Latescibacterota bacterium]